jgi:hypothetical protein
LDNLSAHKNKEIRAWADANAVMLQFTAAYASWANPIEAQSGPLRQFTMAHPNRANHTEQTHDLQASLRWRNANSRHPDAIAAQRRERAVSAARRACAGEADASNSPSPHDKT